MKKTTVKVFEQIHVWESILEPRAWISNSRHHFVSFTIYYGFISIISPSATQKHCWEVTHHDSMDAQRGRQSYWKPRAPQCGPQSSWRSTPGMVSLTSSMVISPVTGIPQTSVTVAFSKALGGLCFRFSFNATGQFLLHLPITQENVRTQDIYCLCRIG